MLGRCRAPGAGPRTARPARLCIDSARERRVVPADLNDVHLRRVEQAHDELHVLPRHRLHSFVDETLGGSAGRVDVMGRKARYQASLQEEDPPLALPKVTVTGTTGRNALLDDHSEHNPVAEVADILELELQLLVRAEPVLKETAESRSPLEGAPYSPRVKDRIGSEEAHRRIQVTPIRRLEGAAHKLYRVAGRGLLGHRPPSIPLAGQWVATT